MKKISSREILDQILNAKAENLANNFSKQYWRKIDAGKDWNGAHLRQTDAECIILDGDNIGMLQASMKSSPWINQVSALAAKGVNIEAHIDVTIPLDSFDDITKKKTIEEALNKNQRTLHKAHGNFSYQTANIRVRLVASENSFHNVRRPHAGTTTSPRKSSKKAA